MTEQKKCPERDRQNIGKESNIFSPEQTRQVSKPNFHSFKENRKISFCNHFGDIELSCVKIFLPVCLVLIIQ